MLGLPPHLVRAAVGEAEVRGAVLRDELVLSILMNGQEIDPGAIVARLEDGELAVDAATLAAWRIAVPAHPPHRLGGRDLYALASVPGLRYDLDEAHLSLRLSLDAAALDPFRIRSDALELPPPSSGTGAFLNYDALWTMSTDGRAQLNGLVELGGYTPWGTASTSFIGDDLATAPQVVRLETRLVRDLPGRRASLRLGDGVTQGGAFAPPVRFGGIEYATDFATDPAFVTFPLPVIGGLADQDSTVDVIVNNLTQFSRQVPSGPFRLDTPPIVTGAGEVQLRVTDLLGRERVVTQPFYVSTRLLQAGLHDFSYTAGALRQEYGQRSFDYSQPFASATHRYGLTDWLTLEGHAEGAFKTQGMAAGGTVLAGRFGVFSGGLGLAHDEEAGLGWQGQLAYDYQTKRFDAGVSTSYRSDGARGLGGAARPGRRDRLNLGLNFGELGRLSLLFVNETGEQTSRAALATYTVQAGPGALFVNLGQTLSPDQGTALTIGYSLPLGQHGSASTQARLQDGRHMADAAYHYGRTDPDHAWELGLHASAGDDPPEFDGHLGYSGRRAAAQLDYDHSGGTDNLRAGVQGSLVAAQGMVTASHRLGPAFGIVETGYPDVRVYLENREVGKTDADGRLLLPELQPYQANRVRINVDDLPLDAVVEQPEQQAVPFARSGAKIAFAIGADRRATVVLEDGRGRPLLRGLVLHAGPVEATVGLDGFAQVLNLPDGEVVLHGDQDGVALACPLPARPKGDVLSDLGRVRCE